MRRFFLTAACALGAVSAACSPLRQPLGSFAAASTGTAGTGSAAGASGSAGSSGVLTGNQIPSLQPEWGQCDPTVFRCFQDPGLSLSSPVSGLFSGASNPDSSAKPVIVYPLAGAMHPINSADITFQWRRAPDGAQTVFRIRLQRANSDVFEFFVQCKPPPAVGPTVDNAECVFPMPPGAWLDAATTARGETLTVDITGVDPKNPLVATSDPITLAFSPEDVRGGLYYWTSKFSGTARLLFGARATLPFIVPSTPSNPNKTCGGCHAVSRNGSTIAFEQGDTGGVLRVARTANADTPLFAPGTVHDSGTQAVNHDGSRVLVSFSGRLILRDTATGTALFEVNETQLGLTQHAFHPEWSPDDQSIVVTVSSQGSSDWSVRTGAIGVLPYNGGQFGPVQLIVPTGTEFNFYPTWSPDGHWIAFATAPVGAGTGPTQVTSYDQVNARLRLVNRDTHVVFELAAASGKAGSTSTWPKFAPFTQAGGLMFLTFNAKLDYGFFLPNNAGGVPQLWMTVLDVSKLATGADASRPPVWMPFQDVTLRNYLGTWSETVGCRADANGQSVGCGDHETCHAGACAMVAP
jgi:hypothetical protein